MSLKSNKSWFRRLGLAAIAALALGTAMIPTAPADAALRVFDGHHGFHVAIVQHPHHDWWRWHHDGWYR
ncbi:MAG TPA: hypothetical protein VNV38_00395 [Stellaceae bacterium]|jgi:hypothetical protein|nr:hypothetical protein [Stellaceae bacterium]